MVKVVRNPATLRQGRDSEVPRQLLCFPIQQQEAQTRVSAGAVCTARRAQKLPTAGESLMNLPFPTAAEKRQQQVCCHIDVILMSFCVSLRNKSWCNRSWLGVSIAEVLGLNALLFATFQ